VYVEGARFLRAETAHPVKFTLPGPMTMVDALHGEHYRSRERLAWEFAQILNQAAREIAAAGLGVIQFDEPAFNVFFDEVRDWGVKALAAGAAIVRSELGDRLRRPIRPLRWHSCSPTLESQR
jgi:5-methyltetrahydropteroyltriglutamate--homocysteine methyltransferase